MRSPEGHPLDARGIAIHPPAPCPVCGAMVSTRPDGSVRSHSVLRSELHPRLGVVACDGGKRR